MIATPDLEFRFFPAHNSRKFAQFADGYLPRNRLGRAEEFWNARIGMKTHLAVSFFLALMVLRLHSQEAVTNSAEPAPIAPDTNAIATPVVSAAATNAFTPVDAAAYGTLNKNLLESNAQFQLLTDLARDHRKRATDFAADQPERSKWETDLANELTAHASSLLKQVNELSRQRLAFERAHRSATNTIPGLAVNLVGNGLNPDEVAYIAKIQERLERAKQDIALAMDQANLYAQEVHTNNVPDEVARISTLLNENNTELRALQKEQSDLELKLLEFRALRRR